MDRGAGPFELLKGLDLLPAGMGYADWFQTLRKFNPNRRGPGPGGGQFCSTDDGGNGGQDKPDENTASITPAAAQADSVQAKKEKFVDDHLADADKAAQKLGVPIENILGLSALESRWGEGRFAAEGNNYFSLHAPAQFQTGTMTSAQDGKMATFASYADSLNSFIASYGHIVQGISDPAAFAAALQNAGLFGINGDDGTKVPWFVSETAATIRGLRPFIARRKA